MTPIALADHTVIEGPAGTGYRYDGERGPANIALWFLRLPGAHPFWTCYLLSAVHLRRAEGLPTPKLQVPDATHEVALVVLDPEHRPHQSNPATWSILTPPNVCEQVAGLTDDQVPALAARLVMHLVAGRLYAEPVGIFGAAQINRNLIREAAASVAAGRYA